MSLPTWGVTVIVRARQRPLEEGGGGGARGGRRESIIRCIMRHSELAQESLRCIVHKVTSIIGHITSSTTHHLTIVSCLQIYHRTFHCHPCPTAQSTVKALPRFPAR